MLEKITEFAPKLINIEIRHNIIQALIFVNIAYPIAEDAVGPAKARFHIDDGNANGQVLYGIGRSLIDALGNGIKKLTDFLISFVVGFMCQYIYAANDNAHQEGDDPVVHGDDQQ